MTTRGSEVIVIKDGARVSVDAAVLPKRMIGLSMTPFDKFPMGGAARQLDLFRPDNVDVYSYLGMRERMGQISTGALLTRAVEGLVARVARDDRGRLTAISDRVRDAGGAAAKALAGQLRAVARADNAWPEVRDAVIDAMPALSKSLAAAVKETLPGGVNAAEAQVAMGVGQKLFQRIREGDHLKPVIDGGHVNRFQIFSGDAVAPVREALQDRIGLGSARRLLGISRHRPTRYSGDAVIENSTAAI